MQVLSQNLVKIQDKFKKINKFKIVKLILYQNYKRKKNDTLKLSNKQINKLNNNIYE